MGGVHAGVVWVGGERGGGGHDRREHGDDNDMWSLLDELCKSGARVTLAVINCKISIFVLTYEQIKQSM